MTQGHPHGVLGRFLSGLTETTFHGQLGVADPPLVDYLVGLLMRFVHRDAVYSVRDLKGRRLDEVAEMMAEAQARVGLPQREVHRHIGDYTLFFSGVFPEALAKRRRANRKDHLVEYAQQGKRAYWIASTLGNEEHAAESDVLARLSSEFELCAYGLNQVRRQWEQRGPDDASPGELLIN